jgi:hypothetical protein
MRRIVKRVLFSEIAVFMEAYPVKRNKKAPAGADAFLFRV